MKKILLPVLACLYFTVIFYFAYAVLTKATLTNSTAVATASMDPSSLEELRAANVMVLCHGYSGSGPVFLRDDTAFIWTAAHVIPKAQHINTVIDSTGKPVVRIEYDDVKVVQEFRQGGRVSGEMVLHAKVLRYSDPERGGDDIALLRVYHKGMLNHGISFCDRDLVPSAGAQLWHVGSMDGKAGACSLVAGMFSTHGRLRVGIGPTAEPEAEANNKVFDQVFMPAIPGASGGGVFLNDFKCIGLLTQGVTGDSGGNCYIVPTRRLYEFAKETNCLWALDPNEPLPPEEEQATNVTHRPVAVPESYKALFNPQPVQHLPFIIPLPGK